MDDGHSAREANKTCGVCGDRALGYNFNAVSCESCKAFFRRNALKTKDFRCPFTENCNITPVTRRFCQKCRLDKCFNIGMQKEYIMSEEDKVLKRKKIEQNRAKKRPGSDNQKITKSKKESVDDSNFEDTSTSIPSVTSSASAVSESYFWESDKKYTDLDGRKQPTVDSMSPVTAASVPSPSSPPENCDIVGSKTLDMLKDSNPIAIQNFIIDEHYDSYNPLDLNIEKNFSSQMNFGIKSSNTFEQEKQQLNEQIAKNEKSFDSCVVSSKCMEPENYFSNSFKPSLEEHQSYMLYSECSSNTKLIEPCVNQLSSSVPQSSAEKTMAYQKSKESCSKGPSLISKVIQNPELISKLVKNPNVIAKIIQEQTLLTKFITDPEIINKLASDPQILQFFQENLTHESIEEVTTHISASNFIETYVDHEISFNKAPDIAKNQVENPILTNLITNQNAEDQYQNSDVKKINEQKEKIDDVTRDILQDVHREPIGVDSLEAIFCEAIKLEYSANSTLSNPSSRELNDAERAKLNELIVANKALLAPLDEDITNLVGDDCSLTGNSEKKDPTLLSIINLTAIAIRRIIKMSKKISAFKNMCQEDQLALLKGGCTEMMLLRSAINYDIDKKIWKIPHSQDRMANLKADILKEAKGNLYAIHSKFVNTFDSRWREENIILILCAITLFSPERPRVVHSDVIKLEQNSYYYLLRRYLESIYPGCEAKSTFLKLIQKMSELHKLNEEVVGVYLNVNPSCVEPLLIEIFDLKL